MQPAAAASVSSVWSTPASRSSQAAIREPSNPGRASATRAVIARPAWCAAVIVERAVPNWPPAIGPVLPSVSTCNVSFASPGRTANECPTSAPWASTASRITASASARSAAAMVSPSAWSPAASSTASIRSMVEVIAPDAGRVLRSALAAPRIVARRANGREATDRDATRASVTAATCACAGPPTIAPSRIALTASAAPRTSRSARMSGSRRWSTTRHTSSSHRNGARKPAPAAGCSRATGRPSGPIPGIPGPGASTAPAPSSSRAASADCCWSTWAAPSTDPTEVITSPANIRKNRRRSGSGGLTGSVIGVGRSWVPTSWRATGRRRATGGLVLSTG